MKLITLFVLAQMAIYADPFPPTFPPYVTSVTSGQTDSVRWEAGWEPRSTNTSGIYYVVFDQPASAFEFQVSFPDASSVNGASVTPPGGRFYSSFSPDHMTETLGIDYGSDVGVGEFTSVVAYSFTPAYVPPIQVTSIKAFAAVPEPATIALASAGLIALLFRRRHSIR